MKRIIVLLTLIIATNGCKTKPVTLAWDPAAGAVGYNVVLTTNKVLNMGDDKEHFIKVFLRTNVVSLPNLPKGRYKAGVTILYTNGIESAPSVIDVDVKK